MFSMCDKHLLKMLVCLSKEIPPGFRLACLLMAVLEIRKCIYVLYYFSSIFSSLWLVSLNQRSRLWNLSI